MSFYEFVLALFDKPAFGTLAGGLAAIMTALALLITWYAKTIQKRIEENWAATHAAVKEVGRQVNGMKDELVAASAKAAYAAGMDKGAATVAQVLPAVVPTPVVQVIHDPDAQPGGQRKYDPPAPAESHTHEEPHGAG